MNEGPFDLAIEEEYQVVSQQTWELCSTIHAILERDHGDGVADVRAEFLQSQMEAGTRACASVGELRSEVRRMRRDAAALVAGMGLVVAAAGTHPFSPWADQRVTLGDRYAALAEELQEVGRRLVTFGLHIHLGVADPNRRIEVMNRLQPYLPLLLALSTSSPFFEGRFTGLRSYRTALLAALPRTGMPPRFSSWSDYQQAAQEVVAAGLVADPSFIWWDVRPNPRVPTVELRITDMPTRVEEAVCLAAWVQALAVKLIREPAALPPGELAIEASKWQAARYGLQASLLLRAGQPALGVREWVEVLLDELDGVADELGCRAELAYALTILDEGSSADRQIAVWRETGSLQAVVAHLVTESGL